MELRQSTAPRRCPLCHDHLKVEQAQGCAECGTDYHGRCLSELGGCSTLGCAAKGVAVEREWRPILGPTQAQAVRQSIGRVTAIAVWLVAALAIAGAVALAVRSPAAWPLYSTFGFAGLVLAVSGLRLFRSK